MSILLITAFSDSGFFGEKFYWIVLFYYIGLPPSPPLPSSSITVIDGGPYTTYDNNGSTIKPFGVDIQKKHNRGDLSKGLIVIIAVLVFVAVVLCTAAVWFMFKFRVHVSQRASIQRPSPPSLTKASGNTTR